ncbi:transcriptional regulator with XRE-family HTH domain [Silvibacterium bohemicum]|uniref:Transcriptional regulator with XRE-family HTH domain n=1 Tax=Silvibacterium bohemicum TaxID=1577686 RepID=A0A841JUH3_9BACT|nr:helix-turn-helix transcriptional regulator [Silvibacterium bohemicum]MBB6142631.1 transcriptional regulator with XRE-family HTH domain [Silvibacterium bohemicum]
MTTAKTSLGSFIRTRRERLRPEEVGLNSGTRRRAKGLRREELAGLCGISPTWLTWIEQGRTESTSAATLSRIARALLLSRAERKYLFELAGIHDPEKGEVAAESNIEESLRDAVRVIQTPAYVLDHAWNAIAWNKPASDLFQEWLAPGEVRPNLLNYMFLNPSARQFIVDWPVRAQRLVAEFRGDCRSLMDDATITSQIEVLRQSSPEFDTFWSTQNVLEREGGERAFVHPQDGHLVLRQLTLRIAHSPNMKLIILF